MKKPTTVTNVEGEQTRHVSIPPPNFQYAEFEVKGPVLVLRRFSRRVKQEMIEKMGLGSTSNSKRRKHAPITTDTLFEEALYSNKAGWHGFHAAGLRNALISACRLVGYKMTIAKMSLFVVEDGYDKDEPQIPLVRLRDCTPIKQEDMARVATGAPYIAVRAAFHDWSAKVRLRWDADQFTLADVTNLLARVGLQVGLCEGRPDSPNSCGMGWGLFAVESVGTSGTAPTATQAKKRARALGAAA